MKARCSSVETSLSYYRRLAQGRIEILEAWQAKRAAGGSLEDLVAELPRILSGGGARPGTAQARLAEPAPEVEPVDLGGRERLVADETLADLPGLDDETLAGRLRDLRDFEHDVSALRHRIHSVLDAIEHEVATRQAAGATG
jgi:hypothetical protein